MTFLLADIPANVFTKFKNILIFRRFHGLKGGLLKQTLQLLLLDNSANFYPCFCFHQKNPPAPLVDTCSVSKMNVNGGSALPPKNCVANTCGNVGHA
jgi:hypothetical protein